MSASTGKTVIITIGVSALAVVASAAGVIYYGLFNVAASQVDPPAMAYVLHLTSDRSVAVRLGVIKISADLQKLEYIKAGAVLYGANCVACHGGPGLTPSAIARGLNPVPPNLFRAGRDAAPEETFWFIKNGVRMTGMASFGKTYSDDKIWSIVAFLKTAPGMSAQEFTAQTGITPALDTQRAGG